MKASVYNFRPLGRTVTQPLVMPLLLLLVKTIAERKKYVCASNLNNQESGHVRKFLKNGYRGLGVIFRII